MAMAASTLDVTALRAELDALRQQRIQAKERLDASRAPLSFGPRPSLPGQGASFLRSDGGDHFGARSNPLPPPPLFGGRPSNGFSDGYQLGGRQGSLNSDAIASGSGRVGGREPLPLYRPRGADDVHRTHASNDLSRSRSSMDMDDPLQQPRSAYRRDAPAAAGASERPRVASRVVSASGTFGRGADDEHGRDHDRPSASGRKRVLSAVVVDEAVKLDRGHVPSHASGPQPRPSGDEVTADPSQKKRARRMFGALMGTLQKFKDEDAQFQASGTAQRRADMARRAEERQAAQAAEARRAAAQQRGEKRREELEKLSSLNLATSIKALELATAQRLTRRALTHGGAFLLTAAGPPLLWVPAHFCSVTLELQQKRRAAHAEWEVSVLAALEVEKAEMTAGYEARRAAAKARAEAAMAARMGGNGHGPDEERGLDEATAAGSGGVEEEQDEQEQTQQEDEELAGMTDLDPAAGAAAGPGAGEHGDAIQPGAGDVMQPDGADDRSPLRHNSSNTGDANGLEEDARSDEEIEAEAAVEEPSVARKQTDQPEPETLADLLES